VDHVGRRTVGARKLRTPPGPSLLIVSLIRSGRLDAP